MNVRIVPGALAVSLLCFFLPFASVSCSGQRIAELSGVQLLTGTTVTAPGGFGTTQSQDLPPDARARLAFVAGLLALVLAARKSYRPSAGAAAGLVLFLLVFKANFAREVAAGGQGVISVEFQPGFWLSLAAGGCGAVVAWVGGHHKPAIGALPPVSSESQ